MKYNDDFKNEISFPLGGIGTGSIGIDGAGRFVDWEIFNRPSKGSINPDTAFAVRAVKGDETVTYMLHGDMTKNLVGQYSKQNFGGYGFGASNKTMCGFPHFKNVEFDGEFPIAELNFSDETFPGTVKLTAFNPFIPNDEDNSSIPAAFFELELKNDCDEKIEYKISLSVHNPFGGKDDCTSHNQVETVKGRKLLKLSGGGVELDDVRYGDLTVATDCDDVKIQEYWYRGTWNDNIVTYWNEFSGDGELSERHYDTDGNNDAGAVCATVLCGAHEARTVRFVLAWNVPNNYCYWHENPDKTAKENCWKNYYATIFDSSADTAVYALENWDMLYSHTVNFKNALHSSTLPKEVIDAASSNLAVLKSPTAHSTAGKAFTNRKVHVKAPVSMFGIMPTHCAFCSRGSKGR